MALNYKILVTITAFIMASSSFLLAADNRPQAACELKIREKYEFYDIDGTNVGDLRKQMKQNGTKWNDGREYAAVTSWDIRYGYEVSHENGGYSGKSVKTDVDIVYHLPRIAASKKGPELTVLWEKYMATLKHHEFGHKALAVKTASEINEILASLGNFSNESELDREVVRRTEEKFQRLKEVQVAYDRETRHGE